jgi:hypothetical protein
LSATFVRFALVAMFALGSMSLAPAAPAAAQTTTEQIDDTECEPEGPFEICVSAQGVEHETIQPDGDIQHVFRGTECLTISVEGQILAEQCAQGIQRYVERKGETQVECYRLKGQVTLEGATCEVSVIYHFANDEVRIDRSTDNCRL